MATDSSNMKEMYDTLSHQFETLKLENREYENEIVKLREEVKLLREEGMFHRGQSVHFTQNTAPLLTSSVARLSAALEESDLLRETSNAENTEYQDIIESLQDDNEALKQQNTQYQQTVEMLHNNQTKQALEYENRAQELQKTIEMLGKENSDILQENERQSAEFEAFKASLETQLNTEMEASKLAGSRVSNRSIHLKFTRSGGPKQMQIGN
eukprot:408358_1